MLNVIMLSVIMLIVIMLCVIMLNVIMLNVVLLNVIMLSVVALQSFIGMLTKLACLIKIEPILALPDSSGFRQKKSFHKLKCRGTFQVSMLCYFLRPYDTTFHDKLERSSLASLSGMVRLPGDPCTDQRYSS